MGLLSKIGGAVAAGAGAILVTTSAPLIGGAALLGAVVGDGMEEDKQKNAHLQGHKDGFREGIKDTEAKAQQNK